MDKEFTPIPLTGNPHQEPDRFMILSVLNASCGDMLKAQVLAAVLPGTFDKLDLTRIKRKHPPRAAAGHVLTGQAA